jgi:hypothetical protein
VCNNCVIIQKHVRGFLVRNYLQKQKDKMTLEIINILLEKYNENLLFNEKINKLLSKKKIRNENFPSHISENIVKYAIYKKYKIMPSWDTKKGDICIEKYIPLQIEVKGFMSDGPSSFGPTEQWDKIYFIDCKDCVNKKFKIFEINLSNNNIKFRSIKLNKNETYGEISDKNQRGKLRGCFYNTFYKQLKEDCKIIFDGHISELN